MTHNPVRPWRNIERRRSRQIHVGSVAVGGDAPISVQTMTNTLTTDVAATIAQVQAAAEAGADIVRVSCPDEASTAALREIVRESPVPIVADIHFHYRRAIEAAEAGAACLRINPGNIGSPERVREVIQAAQDHGCSMRIGVNAGSLERHLLEKYGEPCPEAMVESGARPHPHPPGQRLPRVQDQREGVGRVPRRRRLPGARRGDRRADPPRDHRGGRADVRARSSRRSGSAACCGWGSATRIRVSLSADPVEEVEVGFDILKALGLRHRGVNIISCPSCARQGFDVIQHRRGPREAAGAHQDADVAVDHRLRRQRPGRGADDRRRLHRRRRGVGHGLPGRAGRPQAGQRGA